MKSIESICNDFETAIGMSIWKNTTPLGKMTINGAFNHYADSDTDTMFLGFALCIRYQERLSIERINLLSILLKKNHLNHQQ